MFTNIERSLKTLDERYKLADVKLVMENMQPHFLKKHKWFLRGNDCILVDAPKRKRVCAYENCGIMT